MNKYKFCYSTTYERKIIYIIAESYGEALAQYREMVNTAVTTGCYLDYVFKCNENGEPIEIMYG